MVRRYTYLPGNVRFYGHVHTKEVHDLDNEKKSCQIDKIVKGGNGMAFPSLSTAEYAGFTKCAHCINE